MPQLFLILFAFFIDIFSLHNLGIFTLELASNILSLFLGLNFNWLVWLCCKVPSRLGSVQLIASLQKYNGVSSRPYYCSVGIIYWSVLWMTCFDAVWAWRWKASCEIMLPFFWGIITLNSLFAVFALFALSCWCFWIHVACNAMIFEWNGSLFMTLEARKSIIKFDSVYSELFAKKLVLETHVTSKDGNSFFTFSSNNSKILKTLLSMEV